MCSTPRPACSRRRWARGRASRTRACRRPARVGALAVTTRSRRVPFRHSTSTTTRVNVPSIQGNAIAPTSPAGPHSRSAPLQAARLGEEPPPWPDRPAASASWRASGPESARSPTSVKRQRRGVELVTPRRARRRGTERRPSTQRRSPRARRTGAPRPVTGAPRSDSDRRSPAPLGRPRACCSANNQSATIRGAARPRPAARPRRRSRARAADLRGSRAAATVRPAGSRCAPPESGPNRSFRSSAVRSPAHDGPAQRPRIGTLPSGLARTSRARPAPTPSSWANATTRSRSGAASRRGSGASPASARGRRRRARGFGIPSAARARTRSARIVRIVASFRSSRSRRASR